MTFVSNIWNVYKKRREQSSLQTQAFSCGYAQEITLQAPDLVRRLILVGTGPRSGESMDTGTPEGKEIFGAAPQQGSRS